MNRTPRPHRAIAFLPLTAEQTQELAHLAAERRHPLGTAERLLPRADATERWPSLPEPLFFSNNGHLGRPLTESVRYD